LRTCLINAPIATDYGDPKEYNSRFVREECCLPQLGILSLAAVLEKAGRAPAIFDINRAYFRFADGAGEQRIHEFADAAAEEIAAVPADVYGFGSICSGYPVTLRLARLVKARRPEAAILLGGPQASVVAEATLAAFPFVDFILRGEAEHSLPVFLDQLSGARRFDAVPGLVYRSPFGIQRNADSAPIMDLDFLPRPAYHLTDELRGGNFASIEVGRGCPFACRFCSTNDFFRRKFRLRSPERVLEDMRALDAAYGIQLFQLNHDMFTVDRKRVKEFCRFMIAAETEYKWACSARTDCIDEELITLMAAAGCREVFFGVETGSPRMQKILDKHLDIPRAREIINLVEKAGMASIVSLIVGFPEETWEDTSQTVDMFMHAARAHKSKPQLLILAPLTGTPIHVQHKHELILGDLCSEMSRQGRRNHDEDAELIRSYPDIFSSFYLVPTPHLDGATLFELRAFLSDGVFRMRWLLAAAAQAPGGLPALFLEWLKTRKALHPELEGNELRWYHRQPEFRQELCGFLRGHSAPGDRRVDVLLDFYEAVAHTECSPSLMDVDGEEQQSGETLAPSDVVVRNNEYRVVEFEWDLNQVIQMIKDDRHEEPEKGRRFYLVPQGDSTRSSVCEVSPYIAKLASECDGLPTIRELMKRLAEGIKVSPRRAQAQVYTSIIEEARAEGVISIWRPVPPKRDRITRSTNLIPELQAQPA
jgi:radical SAM superfamily enzyme YgiQ (UPF0313 family)